MILRKYLCLAGSIGLICDSFSVIRSMQEGQKRESRMWEAATCVFSVGEAASFPIIGVNPCKIGGSSFDHVHEHQR